MDRKAVTRQVLDDLRDLWEHLDEEHPVTSAGEAAGMVKAGCKLILATEPKSLADALAQAALLLTMVRETILEAVGEQGEPS